MIVVDTNIIAHAWLPSDIGDLVSELVTTDPNWIAPILWRSEFRSVLGKLLRAKKIGVAKAIEIVEAAEEQMVSREFSVPSRAVIEVMNQSGLSAYDSEFVALAASQQVRLVTLDRKIVRECPDVASHLTDFLAAEP